ncbi:MAG: hypothetical protein EOO24_52650, partial [Comamonadaceae bacterium]
MQAIRPLTLTAVGLAALLSLAGCGERSDTTAVGQKADSAVDRTGQVPGLVLGGGRAGGQAFAAFLARAARRLAGAVHG